MVTAINDASSGGVASRVRNLMPLLRSSSPFSYRYYKHLATQKHGEMKFGDSHWLLSPKATKALRSSALELGQFVGSGGA
jgi:hypothetical protein